MYTQVAGENQIKKMLFSWERRLYADAEIDSPNEGYVYLVKSN